VHAPFGYRPGRSPHQALVELRDHILPRISDLAERLCAEEFVGAVLAAEARLMEHLVCSSCGAANRPEATFCARCGARLTAVAPEACPRCGARLPTGARFCEACGSAVPGATVAVRAAAPRAAGWRWLATLLVLLASPVLGFGAVVGYYGFVWQGPLIDGAQDIVLQGLTGWRDMRDPRGRFRFKIPPDATAYFATEDEGLAGFREVTIHAREATVSIWMTALTGNADDRTYLMVGFSLFDSPPSKDLGFSLINEHALRRPGIRGHYLDMLYRTGFGEERFIVLSLRPTSRPGERWLVTVQAPHNVLIWPQSRDLANRILMTLEFRPR